MQPKKPINNDKFKDLGKLYWKDVISRKIYNQKNLTQKNYPKEILNGSIEVSLSSERSGTRCTAILDREFFKIKAKEHFLKYFDSKQEAKDFLDECWDESSKQALLEKISQLTIELRELGLSEEQIKDLLLKQLKDLSE